MGPAPLRRVLVGTTRIESLTHTSVPIVGHTGAHLHPTGAHLHPKGPGGHTVNVEYASEWRDRGHRVLVRPQQGPCARRPELAVEVLEGGICGTGHHQNP